MKFFPCNDIPDLVVIDPVVHGDARGQFFECYREDQFRDAGIRVSFVQDNQSVSTKGVLRGLHLQKGETAQAKCVRVLQGSIFDVAVDVRPNSATFGKWKGVTLSEDNKRMFYIPEGFAHGFLTLSDTAILHYKCSNFYSPKHEETLRYDDPEVGIDWPKIEGVVLSEKDQRGKGLEFFRENI